MLGELIRREKTGKGAKLRTGLFENCLLLVAQHMVQFDIEGVESPPMPERVFSWPVYDIFETRENRQLFVGAVTEGQWSTLCGILGLGQLLVDPELQTRLQQIAARDRTIPLVAKAIRHRMFDQLTQAFEEAGIPFSPIARPAQMYDDAHVNRPDGLRTSRYADKKDFSAPGLPFSVNGKAVWPDTVDLPQIGEHTAEIFAALKDGQA